MFVRVRVFLLDMFLFNRSRPESRMWGIILIVFILCDQIISRIVLIIKNVMHLLLFF